MCVDAAWLLVTNDDDDGEDGRAWPVVEYDGGGDGVDGLLGECGVVAWLMTMEDDLTCVCVCMLECVGCGDEGAACC